MIKDKHYYEEVASQEEFLTWYKQQDLPTYEKPSVTVDFVCIRYNRDEQCLEALLVKRKRNPWRGMYSLVGGFLKPNEDVIDAGIRELKEETNLDVTVDQIKQLPAWTKPNRDPRGWVITNPLVIQLKDNIKAQAGDDAQEVYWLPLDELPQEMASDHREILTYGLETIKTRLEVHGLYAIETLLGDEFSIKDVQLIVNTLTHSNKPYNNFKREYADQLVEVERKAVGKGRPQMIFTLQ